jgi:hypothetical protein
MAKIETIKRYEDAHENEAAIVRWGRDFYTCYRSHADACGCGGGWRCGGGSGNTPEAAVKGLTYGPAGAEQAARMLLRDAVTEIEADGYSIVE